MLRGVAFLIVLSLICVAFPPALIAIAIMLIPPGLKSFRDSFNFPLVIVCAVIALISLGFMARHFNWVPPCVFSIENWVDSSAALVLILGTSWAALGVVLTRKQAVELQDKGKTLTTQNIADALVLASHFARQALVPIIIGSGILVFKPVIVKFESRREPATQPCPGTEAPQLAPTLVPESKKTVLDPQTPGMKSGRRADE